MFFTESHYSQRHLQTPQVKVSRHFSSSTRCLRIVTITNWRDGRYAKLRRDLCVSFTMKICTECSIFGSLFLFACIVVTEKTEIMPLSGCACYL